MNQTCDVLVSYKVDGNGRPLTFIGVVIQIEEIWFPLLRQGSSIHSVTVILRCDMALSSCEIQCRNVVSSVPIFELYCLSSCG